MSPSTIFKEVVLAQTQIDKWNEICFNRAGAPSTLQDIKVVPHSGGYCFKQAPNRFFYWRSNYDTLEMIEHSLSTSLLNNQIRYRFESAPVLDGITVHEKSDHIVVLVPTVCSVHRFIFPHPICNNSYDICVLSIFAEASLNSARDPTLYRFFDTMPNLPHTANSALSEDNDALFCFAMNNASILLIRLQHQTGIMTQSYLKTDNRVPRFLSGITEVFRGGKSNNDNTVISLVMKQFNQDTYIFALSRNGQLRTWSCSQEQCICTLDIVPPSSTLSVEAHRNIIRASTDNRILILAVYLSLIEHSQIIIIKSFVTAEGLKLESHKSIHTEVDQDLVEMKIESGGDVIWCIWRSHITGETSVSMITLHSGKWTRCISDRLSSMENHMGRLTAVHSVTPNELYFNLIFAPGLFSSPTIAKVLNLIQGEHQVDLMSSKLDLRSKVCTTIEAQILKEASGYEFSDQDYLEIINRHWNHFYTNCCQYQETDRQPNGLIWLPEVSMLILIAKNNLSFFRNMDILEHDLVSAKDNEIWSYGPLIDTLQTMEFSTQHKLHFIDIENGVQSLEIGLEQIVSEIKLDTALKTKADALLKYNDLSKALRKLSDILYMPETFENSSEFCELFRGVLATSIVVSSARQIVQVRLEICYKLALLLLMLDSASIQSEFLFDACNFCRAYAILNWCCNTSVPDHPDMTSITQYLLSKTDHLRQPMILDTVWALCEYLWSLTNSQVLAEFLSETKQHLLLQDYARLVNYNCGSWKLLLLQSYIETSEPYKAYDLVREEDNIDNVLKIIPVFEKAEHSNIVINLAEYAISKALLPRHADLPTLYSILFIHHLKLCHYNDAYNNIERNVDETRRADCLREFIIRLININAIDKLLEFPYNGMVSQLEDIMLKRARSLRSSQAAIYYAFLYSFYIKNNNFRRAASIMHEEGYRAENNEMQKHCYAACLNSLSLVNPSFAWVLKPKPEVNYQEDEDSIDILEIADVRREYELASARCKLQNCPPESTPQEVMTQLLASSLYRPAIRIASLCKLRMELAFESLASACVHINRDIDPWNWLVANDISDLVAGDANATVVAWRILEALLTKYEQPDSSILHKAVANKIMSLNHDIPHWLQLSYKKRNPAELLRLYLKYGEIDEAVKLACDLLSVAVIGKDKESFAVQWSLNTTAPPTCMPWNAIDVLLLELQAQKMDNHFKIVNGHVNQYLNTAVRISKNKMILQH